MELRVSNVTSVNNPVTHLILFSPRLAVCRLCDKSFKLRSNTNTMLKITADSLKLGLNHLQVEHKLQIIKIGGR